MQQVRVAVYTLKSGTADEVIRRAEADLALRFRNEVGFVAYGLVKTGDNAVISLSIWDLVEQATAAVQLAEVWEQESLGGMVDAVETHIGSLAFFWALVAIGR
jgi:heme-degrading monooxygenase HmoA